MSCPYSTLLGIPGQGVHAARIFGIALNDTLMTIAAAALTSYFFGMNLLYSFLAWFIAGEILHYIFGVNTAFLAMIGIVPCPSE
jgi:uncharacterized membrane-anchored protein YitT (DUF2179 family)